MWNRRNSLLPESRRGIGGSVLLHFRAAVQTRWFLRAICVKQKQALVLGSARGQGRTVNKCRTTKAGGSFFLVVRRPPASVRLFGAAVSGEKRKCLENLFPQPPRIAVHGVPDPRLHGLIHRFFID